uniref:CDK5 regulatory subunit associated protein 3 n=1 Tax=Anas platyrhynchos TaxID=8839 RepID=A0A8B9R856_ANAPL
TGQGPHLPLPHWLLDRRHCGRRWQAQARLVRQRMEAALRDMPEHPEIRQLLAAARPGNLFGRYSSQRMKDWQEIVALYEKENTYLAELASLLVRSVSYEAPALRKQISRCQQAQQDFARREEECQLAAAELRERFYASCKQYGITGDNVRQELLALVKELPSLLSEIGAGASALTEVRLREVGSFAVPPSSAEPVLPLLRHVGRRGNTTVYEWRTGLEPVRVERPEVQEVPEQPKEDAVRASGTSDGAATGGAQDEIDWGIALEPSPQVTSGAGRGAGSPVVLWGWGTPFSAPPPVPEGVACGSEALTVLELAETRNQFLDELMEVSGGVAPGPPQQGPRDRGVGAVRGHLPPPGGAAPPAAARGRRVPAGPGPSITAGAEQLRGAGGGGRGPGGGGPGGPGAGGAARPLPHCPEPPAGGAAGPRMGGRGGGGA